MKLFPQLAFFSFFPEQLTPGAHARCNHSNALTSFNQYFCPRCGFTGRKSTQFELLVRRHIVYRLMCRKIDKLLFLVIFQLWNIGNKTFIKNHVILTH